MIESKLFTIGQFARLHGINKKTLMWYDEMDLLKPAAVKGNGYRYYTFRQSPVLETILMLRELDMSIPQIRDFLQNRSMDSFVTLLRGKITEVDARIARLQGIRDILAEQESVYTGLLETDLSRIEIVEKQEELLYVVNTGTEMPLEDEIERVMDAVKERDFKSMHDTVYGSLIPVEKLQRGEYDSYDGLFLKIPHSLQSNGCQPLQTGQHLCKSDRQECQAAVQQIRPENQEWGPENQQWELENQQERPGNQQERPGLRRLSPDGLYLQPAGKYLRAYCTGEWNRLPERYRQILAYANSRGLRLFGCACETGVNETAISSFQEYITLIEIPVKEE